jgi:hypothetical protein
VRIKEKCKVELSVENAQLVRINDEPEDEINTGSPIVEPNENSMRMKDNVNVFETTHPSPSISSEKDKSLFASFDDDSTPIPLKSRFDERM